MDLLVRDLFERAAGAARRVVRVQSRAVLVVAVHRRLKEGRLVVQCAWCGRVSDDGERWQHVPSVVLRPEQVTGSICDACLAKDSPQTTRLTPGGRVA